jgi:hypothetical protein
MKLIKLFVILFYSTTVLSQKEVEVFLSIDVNSSSWDYFTRFNANAGKPDITMNVVFDNKIMDTHYNEDNSCKLTYNKTYNWYGSDSVIVSLIDRDEGTLNTFNEMDFIGSYSFFVADTMSDFWIDEKTNNFKISGSVRFKKKYLLSLRSINFNDEYDDRLKKFRGKDLNELEITLYKGYTPLQKIKIDKKGFKKRININHAFALEAFTNDEFRLMVKNEKTFREIEFIITIQKNGYKITRKDFKSTNMCDLELIPDTNKSD